MVEFPNAAADPEAVVVKFAHAPVALPTVSTSVGLLVVAGFTLGDRVTAPYMLPAIVK